MSKDFGDIPTNITGTAGQIVRIKLDESGFEFVAPPVGPTGPTGSTGALGPTGSTGSSGSITAFQWSTSEQVWPFEKNDAGNTLYCQYVNLGSLPNTGSATVFTGTNFDVRKVFRYWGTITQVSGTQSWLLPLLSSSQAAAVMLVVNASAGSSTFYIQDFSDYSSWIGKGYVIYSH